jgi:hypothetical protein
MCPACIGSAVLYIASGSSAGGVALLAKRVLRRQREPLPQPSLVEVEPSFKSSVREHGEGAA